jgi:putative nucleotidyltransferase with HDIG domain
MNIKRVVRELANGKKLDISNITAIADGIYQCLSETANENIIRYISQIKRVDEYTYQHSLNVAFYCMLFGRWLNFSADEIKEAVLAGLLHDIGKAKVPLVILNKPAKLTDKEFSVIKKHPIYGYLILEESNFINMDIKRAVLLHHERINRKGYPFNVSDHELSILTRIVSLSDVYDAITSDRIYKKKATPFSAFEMFLTDANSNYDSYLVGKFVSNMAAMLTGSDVLLSNGDKGKVVYVPPHDVLSPIVCADGKYITLAGSGLEIVRLS